MPLNMANMALLVKTQTVLGTPVVPAPGANAMLVRAMTPALLKGKYVERNLVRGAKGNYGSIVAGVYRSFEFEVELSASGVAGTAPKIGPLLMACNMSETVTAATSVVYQPIAGQALPVTMYGYLDGVMFQMSDARGTVSFSMNAEEIPVAKFNFIGKYHPMTDVAFPTGLDFSGFKKPLTVGFVNTPTYTVHGLAVVMQQFSLDLANELVWRDLVGFAGARVPDRKPKLSTVFELTNVATRNWGESVRLGTEGAVSLVHGVTAGSIVQFDLPVTAFDSDPTISDLDKVAMLNGSLAVMPNTGNDELVLTFK